jgi:hypothetical protein
MQSLLLAAVASTVTSAEPRLYELQKLQAAPVELDALHARIRDHWVPLLDKHGIKAAGVFTPVDENPERIVYVLVAGDGLIKSWADFLEDLEWKKVLAEGKFVTDVPSLKRGQLRTGDPSSPISIHAAAASESAGEFAQVREPSGGTCSQGRRKDARCHRSPRGQRRQKSSRRRRLQPWP